MALKKAGVVTYHIAHDYRQICPANALLDGNGLRCNDCKQGLHKVLIKNCKKKLSEIVDRIYRSFYTKKMVLNI